MPSLNHNSLYVNQGNTSILDLVRSSDQKILDVGCGAGSTGKLIITSFPQSQVTGITCSLKEYEQANSCLSKCFYLDLERDSFDQIDKDYDLLIFAHVLEHLVDPVACIRRLLPHLKPGGRVVIALPNIANWRDRWKLALGRFEYTESGIMDKTHLHFYTFHTAAKYLIEPIPQLQLEYLKVNGSVPLGFLRHQILRQRWRQKIDYWGCQVMPNLCGSEILMVAHLQ
ncbi:MAG: class I SAM-dependent methyltransferase [Pseudanabaenaceae cyanobacterium bins.68]|nr:class I SAM-dependent methyltransferase [Pseudanabaenaceae cyanobacterium bins.68]